MTDTPNLREAAQALLKRHEPRDPDACWRDLRAALAATPPAEPGAGLDVERLARALPGAFRQMLAGQPGVQMLPDDPNVDARWAIAIAAEYARLAPSATPREAERG